MHRSFSPANANVRSFDAVILPLGLVVPSGRPKVMKRSRVSARSEPGQPEIALHVAEARVESGIQPNSALDDR